MAAKYAYGPITVAYMNSEYDDEVAAGDQTTDAYSIACLLYTSPSPRDPKTSRMPSSA